MLVETNLDDSQNSFLYSLSDMLFVNIHCSCFIIVRELHVIYNFPFFFSNRPFSK